MQFIKPKKQLEIIKQNVDAIIPEDEFIEKLESSYEKNVPLRVKAGFDPNNSDYPHQYKKWPTQFSRGTGFSMQLFLYLGPTKKKKK